MDYLDSGSMYGSVDSAPPAQSDPKSPAPASPAITKPGPIIKEKIPAAPDTDTSTRQTIAKMCEYIAAGASDDVCQWWANEAKTRFAPQPKGAADQCWGVWWLVKHAVKFAKDEPRLFQIGEPDALDLLIAPAVLVREQDRKEDCDGFTMLVCCLLKILGIPSVIVTVAADPENPERWSHVFPMAQLGNVNMSMDASHGKFPGWMVPREHIFRWQAWDLSGNPVEAFPTQMRNTLHGYVPQGMRMRRRRRGMRGLGQSDPGDDLGAGEGDPGDSGGGALPISTPVLGPFAPQAGLTESGGVVAGTTSGVTPGTCVGSGCTSSGSSTDLTSVLNSLITGGLKAAQLATLPAGYTLNPATGQLVYTGQSAATAQLTSSFASILPWLAIGAVALIVLPLVMGKK